MKSKPYRFRLYVIADHVGSQRAEPDLRAALDACVPGAYHLEVVDVKGRPDLAEADRVIAAPTVIRLAPLPMRRAIGSLADARAVGEALALLARAG